MFSDVFRREKRIFFPRKKRHTGWWLLLAALIFASFNSGCAQRNDRIELAELEAQPHDCMDWTRSSQTAPGVLPTQSFGCANRHNLSVMLDDPRDLYGHRTVDPLAASTDGTIADGAITRYRTDARKLPETDAINTN